MAVGSKMEFAIVEILGQRPHCPLHLLCVDRLVPDSAQSGHLTLQSSTMTKIRSAMPIGSKMEFAIVEILGQRPHCRRQQSLIAERVALPYQVPL
jgi:hypothetical protein